MQKPEELPILFWGAPRRVLYGIGVKGVWGLEELEIPVLRFRCCMTIYSIRQSPIRLIEAPILDSWACIVLVRFGGVTFEGGFFFAQGQWKRRAAAEKYFAATGDVPKRRLCQKASIKFDSFGKWISAVLG